MNSTVLRAVENNAIVGFMPVVCPECIMSDIYGRLASELRFDKVEHSVLLDGNIWFEGDLLYGCIEDEGEEDSITIGYLKFDDSEFIWNVVETKSDEVVPLSDVVNGCSFIKNLGTIHDGRM
jgi:hypothetical protein